MNGTLSVSVRVNDGTADSPPFEVKIQITPISATPKINGQRELTMLEDSTLTIQLTDLIVTDGLCACWFINKCLVCRFRRYGITARHNDPTFGTALDITDDYSAMTWSRQVFSQVQQASNAEVVAAGNNQVVAKGRGCGLLDNKPRRRELCS